jgi:branched-chain amino acid transport system ATP-binding protein
MTEPLIKVYGLSVRHGAATALDDVSLDVGEGELVALIGPNGAGKSTLVDTVSGLLKPYAGTVSVNGVLAHVPEGRQLFGPLSVEDNLRLGAWRRRGRAARDTSFVYELLPELVRVRRQRADTLSGGQQQMVALGRALMSRPTVLVIDEMSLGLAPLVVDSLVEHLTTLHERDGLAVLLIEQNARLALDICSRAYVLEAGRIVASGTSEELAASPAVADAYLGGGL